MIHEYTTPVSKALYEEYGQIETSLMLQGIQSIGVHIESGFRGEDNQVYHHMLLVMAPRPLDNLHELFPGVKTQWTHKERQQDGKQRLNTDPYITHMKNGKLHIDTKDATFRV